MKEFSEEPYVLTSWVNAFLAGYQMEGCDEHAIVSLSGVDPLWLEKGYCSLETFVAVFDAAKKLYGDSMDSVSRKGVTPSAFRSLSIAMLSSDTLADGFGLLVKHNSSITNVMEFISDAEGGGRFGFARQEGIELSLSLSCSILDKALRTALFIHPISNLVNKVEMTHAKPTNAQQYEDYFCAPVEWACPLDVLYFNEHAYSSPSIHANTSLRINAEKEWLEEIASFNEANFIVRVNAFIQANLSGTRLTIEYASTEFGMSVRTFQRRLDADNASFSQLIDQIRRKEALALIKDIKVTISDLAFSLGFSDVGSFSRAFRRWFDRSPEQYRKQNS